MHIFITICILNIIFKRLFSITQSEQSRIIDRVELPTEHRYSWQYRSKGSLTLRFRIIMNFRKEPHFSISNELI